MAEPKTRPTTASAELFLNKVQDEGKRDDCFALLKLMKAATKSAPVMWGPAIVGFGVTKIMYKDGKALDWPIIGFSPRKDSLVLYMMPDFPEKKRLLKKLGKHKTGVSCLYIKKLKDVDEDVLKQLIAGSVKAVKA